MDLIYNFFLLFNREANLQLSATCALGPYLFFSQCFNVDCLIFVLQKYSKDKYLPLKLTKEIQQNLKIKFLKGP